MPPVCERLNAVWICSRRPQHLAETGGVVHVPVLLRRKSNARPVRSAALVGAAERCGPTPRRSRPVGETDNPEARTFALRSAISCSPINS